MSAGKLIVANWKLNPSNETGAIKLAKASRGNDIVICPPFVYLSSVASQGLSVKMGAQDAFWENAGAYTGEIGPIMLKGLGVKYTIIGHSERRKWLKETDEMVNKKVLSALGAGLKVILCVGEPLAVRRRGLIAAKKFVKSQLQKDLLGLGGIPRHKSAGLIVAYEPIWAIGTGRPDKPTEAAAMARFIKSLVVGRKSSVKVLYGGSVDSKNAENFLQFKDIDGALVGGASLKPGELKKIMRIASKNGRQ